MFSPCHILGIVIIGFDPLTFDSCLLLLDERSLMSTLTERYLTRARRRTGQMGIEKHGPYMHNKRDRVHFSAFIFCGVEPNRQKLKIFIMYRLHNLIR